MKWAGISVALGLATVGVLTLPYGLLILAPLVWFFYTQFRQ